MVHPPFETVLHAGQHELTMGGYLEGLAIHLVLLVLLIVMVWAGESMIRTVRTDSG